MNRKITLATLSEDDAKKRLEKEYEKMGEKCNAIIVKEFWKNFNQLSDVELVTKNFGMLHRTYLRYHDRDPCYKYYEIMLLTNEPPKHLATEIKTSSGVVIAKVDHIYGGLLGISSSTYFSSSHYFSAP